MVMTKIEDIKATDLYDKFWEFANERQNISIKRLRGEMPPWTSDLTLQNYKFTSAYRFLDRVSQYLIKNVIYVEGDFSEEDTFFRILLFKVFNKIETWQKLESEIGKITFSSYNFKLYDKILTEMIGNSIRIYSAAYIMPSGTTSYGYSRKHRNNLKLLEKIMKDDPISQLKKMRSLEDLYIFFLRYPTIGNFLAYQYAIDINYSRLCNFSEMDFVVAGPGAIRGINKCFKNVSKKDYSLIIKYVTVNQEKEFEKRNIEFKYINNRKLQLIDIQNLFCEIDKYSRRMTLYNSTNCRIKQRFKQNPNLLTDVMPNKWNKGDI